MSATLSSTEQKVYNKVMASKKKAMTLAQIEAAIPGLSRKDMNSAINNILRLKLFTAAKGKDEVLVFHAVAVEDAKKQNTLTEEQQYVLSIIDKAGNKGISRPAIANQVSTELMARSQVFKALEALEKSQLVKTFKSVNAPTMPLYILAHLKPPEDIAGGIWFDESKEYDSVFVDSLRMVVYKYVQHKTFPPQKKDAISALCPNPIYPVSKTPSLPTSQELLGHIQKNKVTTAKLTVKNVMEICRALELDGLIEAIKPIGGVSVEPTYDSDSDGEPVTKRHKGRHDDDDLDPKERERRERKEREKLKAKIKEKKREQRRRERAREKEKERERKKKEKEKERKRKEKERERKRKEKEKERKRKEKEKKKKKRIIDSDEDNSDEELRAIDDDDIKSSKSKSKRKRRIVDSDDSGSDSDSDSDSSSSSSSSDSDSDSSSDSESDNDSDVSSVMSDDLEDGDGRPKGTMGISSNPFFSADGRQSLIDLSDQAVVYRAVRRLHIPLGQNQASCGTCPQFNFCEQDGPVNPAGCQYITDWLAGTNGGWTADVKAEKAKKAAEEEKERRRAAAEAAGEVYDENAEANGHDQLEEDEPLYEADDKGDDMEW